MRHGNVSRRRLRALPEAATRPSVSALVSLASNAVALGALALAWSDALPAMPLPFLWHKALHVAGVILFGGNLVAGPLWLALAWASGDRKTLAFAARALSMADVWLTTPGVQLAIWNGLFAAQAYGGVSGPPWLVETAALMIAVSVLSCTVVLYWQERLVAACEAGDDAAIRRALVVWGAAGTALSIPFLWVFALMIGKRALVAE